MLYRDIGLRLRRPALLRNFFPFKHRRMIDWIQGSAAHVGRGIRLPVWPLLAFDCDGRHFRERNSDRDVRSAHGGEKKKRWKKALKITEAIVISQETEKNRWTRYAHRGHNE